MGRFRRLAGQTAIYGISSILGRIINYAMVPLHTFVFQREQMGDVGVLFTYATYLLVIYTFGMETTYFRFVNKRENTDAYYQASSAVVIISTVLTIPILFFAPQLAQLIGQPGSVLILRWLALILWIDAIMAIPFARLRHENRPVKFATVKLTQIIVNVGLQLMFLWLMPGVFSIDALNTPEGNPGIAYIFLANLIGNLLLFPLLWRYLADFRLRINWDAFKPMLIYAFPIMLTGLAGMFNESIANLLIRYTWPSELFPDIDSRAAVGIYSNTLKISVFMTLAIQAFRYAAEPFFFSQAKEKDSPELFSKVMHYFILTALAILFAVSLNVDLIGYIFLRRPEYRVALYLVPILLFAKLLYGIYINLSIWFKLTDRTRFGLYFSLIGAAVTIAGNLLLIPLIGYNASALSMVFCYMVMVSLCYLYGQKYYPIPYRFGKTVPYFVLVFLLVLLGNQIELSNFYLESAIKLIATVFTLGIFFFYEKKGVQLPKKPS